MIAAAVLCAAGISTPAVSASRAIRHGSALTVADVGPAAGGFPDSVGPGKREALAGATIKDAAVPSFVRRIETAAEYDGFAVAGPHLLIENVTFSAALDIYATLPLVLRGVTVRIAGASYWGVLSRAQAGPLLVLWSDIGGVTGGGPPSKGSPNNSPGVQRGLYLESANAIVYRSRVSHSSDGIQVHAPGTRVIETLVEDLVTWEGEHNDGIQMLGRGDRLTVERSRIVNPIAQTSALLLQGGGHRIIDNYLSGGGWTVYGGATPHHTSKGGDKGSPPARDIRVTGNIFGQERSPKSGTFGPIADWAAAGGAGPGLAGEDNVWRDNRMADGRPVVPVTPASGR